MTDAPQNTRWTRREIKPAATILLLRDAPSFEVLMVKRHHQIDSPPAPWCFRGKSTPATTIRPGTAHGGLGGL